MRPGFSEKADADPPLDKRVPVGEKGLGRLAAGRLGEQLDVYTRCRASDPWLHLGFRWADFNDMNTPLDEVPVWVDTDSTPPETLAEFGTIVVISRLRMKWDSRVPGRKAKDRAPTRLGRLRQDLKLLLLPLLAADSGFAVDLRHNSPLPEDHASSGPVIPPELRLLDYQFDFALEQDGSQWSVLRTVKRSPALVKRLGLKRETNVEVPIADLDLGEFNPDAVGSFDASIYYAPESASQLAGIRAPVGVRLYRDGVRVDPYGEVGDDWLGVAAYKASRQGHAAIQPKALYGAVRISRRSNGDLRPLANREGLLDNESFQSFLVLCRGELRWLGDLIQREYQQPTQDQRRASREGDKREATAINVQRYAVAVTRAAVHAVRQPVAGAGTELVRLEKTLSDSSMPAHLRDRLQGLHDATKQHLEQIDEAVERLTRFLDFDPTPRTVDVRNIVKEVLQRAQVSAKSMGVTLIKVTPDNPLQLEIPDGLVERALEELVDNATQAPRPEGRTGKITVEAAETETGVRISVIDNGEGVPEQIRDLLFKESVSTGGHIGLGLLFNRQLLALARGDLLLQSSGPEGSRFDVILPA